MNTVKTTAGRLWVKWIYLGLRIEGFCSNKDSQSVEIFVIDKLIRKNSLIGENRKPGKFGFTIKREVIALFPNESILKVLTTFGEPILIQGIEGVLLKIPHGSGKLFNRPENGMVINKKGFFASTSNEINDRYLTIS